MRVNQRLLMRCIPPNAVPPAPMHQNCQAGNVLAAWSDNGSGLHASWTNDEVIQAQEDRKLQQKWTGRIQGCSETPPVSCSNQAWTNLQ